MFSFLPPGDQAIVSAVAGLTLVPWLVQVIVSKPWKNSTKQEIAAAISVAFGIVQFAVAGGHFESLAVTGPIIFASATISYQKYWKEKIGSWQEFDLIGTIFNKK